MQVRCLHLIGDLQHKSHVFAGVIGAYAYLGPKSGAQTFDIPGETADLTFGAITVLTGTFGTLIGGIVLDALGSGTTNALIICSICTLLGCCTSASSIHGPHKPISMFESAHWPLLQVWNSSSKLCPCHLSPCFHWAFCLGAALPVWDPGASFPEQGCFFDCCPQEGST